MNPLDHLNHRPWELPRGPWIMKQVWYQLLFAHWPVRADALRPLIPSALEIDTYDGRAWLGVVPFRMSGVRPRGVTALPWLSAFPELNVRSYVTAGGKAGVYFFSLDAANPLAVRIARGFYHLPYFDADMQCIGDEHGIAYRSYRTHRGAPGANFLGRYRPVGEVYHAARGDLDHWLTERYCLYTSNRRGELLRGEIHHAPWDLQPAAAEIEVNTMAVGIDLPDAPPLLHYAHRLDVLVWALRRAATHVT